MALAAGMRIGKYELKKKLGEGGFGLVFLAYDVDLERDVALKFMHAEHTANKEILRRFLQEARSAAKISHPGIVTVFECSQIANTGTEHDGMAYIAMELLHGESLSDRLRRVRRLPSPAAMEIGRQVAIALEAAHRTGIIHRDLKPDNIFLVTDAAMPGGERVKVLDFGIAKLAQPTAGVATQSQMVFGTPRYMSPEQCRSAANIDHRSDIYTLGCILFELVTGEPPFDGELGELIAKHQMVAAPTARSKNPDVPAALDQLIAQTLAKQPGDRPQTMAALTRLLEGGGNALAAGVAPTLAPDAAESLQRFTPAPGSVPPPDSEVLAKARGVATTLGSANVSREVPPARSSSKRTLAVVAIAALALAGGGIFIATRDGGGDPPPSPAAASGSAPAQPPPPKPKPKDIEIELVASPAAEVYLVADGRLVGTTPYRITRAPAEGSLVFLLKAEGHKDQRVVVPLDKDHKETIELVAIAQPAVAKPTTKPATRPKPVDKPKPPDKPKPAAGSSGHIDVYPE